MPNFFAFSSLTYTTPLFANVIGVSAGLAPFNTFTTTLAVSTPIWYWRSEERRVGKEC